jgi:hypothetical protein
MDELVTVTKKTAATWESNGKMSRCQEIEWLPVTDTQQYLHRFTSDNITEWTEDLYLSRISYSSDDLYNSVSRASINM